MLALQAFSKCGVIKEDDQHRPRIKIYRDRESGMPKGDGLVTYLKDPSVCAADTSLRICLFKASIVVADLAYSAASFVPHNLQRCHR